MQSFITSIAPTPSSSPDTLVITPDGSIGVTEVRQIQEFLAKKPMQSAKNLVYILEAHLLTVPAQNALLKTLEEPPGNSKIYLVTEFTDQLLPTVLSRCHLITAVRSQTPDPSTLTKSQELLTKLQKAGVGERLDLLDAQAFTRDTLGQFLTNLEFILHTNLDIKLDYKAIVQTRKYLKANCNLKLSLAYLASKL
jgi:replication-associated recombination protein RarA